MQIRLCWICIFRHPKVYFNKKIWWNNMSKAYFCYIFFVSFCWIFQVQQKLKKTTNAFWNIWNDNDDTINIFKKNWMFINIISNVKFDLFRVYSFDSQNKKFVNKKFDKFYVEKKFRWTTKPTFYKFSIFVIWKIIHFSNENLIKKTKQW